jgi:gas vesicle protein
MKMLENNKNEYGSSRHSSSASRLRDGMLFFGVGATIGAAVALLFAPKSGNELRGDIADVTRKGYDATLEKATVLKDQSAEVVEIVKKKAAAVYDFAAEKLNTGSDAMADVVSATTGSIQDGIERMQNESGITAKHPRDGRKSSSIV